jgi:hypothetical protein
MVKRYLELGATALLVTLFTALIVMRGPCGDTAPEPPAEPTASARPERVEPSAEVRNAPRLTEVWREDFDTLEAWRCERGRPATISDGLVTLHDAPALPSLYARKQPLRFQAADLVVSARCAAGGFLHIGVAQAVAGRSSELVDPGHTPVVRNGVELRLVWHDPEGGVGWMRWKRDGHDWISLPLPESAFPPDEFVTVTARIRPDGCTVSVDGELHVEYTVPRDALRWRDAPYRIYLGAWQADPEIDSIELRPVTTTTSFQEGPS